MNSKKIGRIKAVQAQLHKRAEIELNAMIGQKSELAKLQIETLEALADRPDIRGQFADLIAGRVKLLAAEEARLEVSVRAQQGVVTEGGLQLKRIEKYHQQLSREEQAAGEKRSLLEITDLLAIRPSGGPNGIF